MGTHTGVDVCDLFTSKPKIKRDVSGSRTPNHSETRPTDERESEKMKSVVQKIQTESRDVLHPNSVRSKRMVV